MGNITEKGFTLIELMIVIAIIALIASIALPKFSETSNQAKAANVQGNLANLRTSIAMFKVKNGIYPTHGSSDVNFETYGEIDEGNPEYNFRDYYSRDKMPYTPGGFDGSVATESYLNNITIGNPQNGGWTYVEESGHIHADLPDNAYGQDINWENE